LNNTIIADHDAIPLSCGQRGKPDRERMTCGLLTAWPSARALEMPINAEAKIPMAAGAARRRDRFIWGHTSSRKMV
jgi:hypothetical protein